jgi:hypothetical protein
MQETDFPLLSSPRKFSSPCLWEKQVPPRPPPDTTFEANAGRTDYRTATQYLVEVLPL